MGSLFSLKSSDYASDSLVKLKKTTLEPLEADLTQRGVYMCVYVYMLFSEIGKTVIPEQRFPWGEN